MQATVREDNEGEKLFSFCHKTIIELSKRELRHCFSQKRIFLNDINVTDECHRVHVGDCVRIDPAERQVAALPLDLILYCSPDKKLAVVYKNCGDSLNIESEFSNQFFCSNNDSLDLFPRSCHAWLYGLDRSCAGLCVIISKSSTTHDGEQKDFYIRFLNNEITLTFHCLVSGKVNCSEGSDLEFRDEKSSDDLVQKLNVKVINHFNCRQTGYVSAIEVVPILRGYYSSLGLSEMLGAMTSLVKKIKSILNANNHRVVGDMDSVKSGKGLYVALVSFSCPLYVACSSNDINLFSSRFDSETSEIERSIGFEMNINNTDTHHPSVTFRCNPPSKFATFLINEEEMYQRAIQRDLMFMKKCKSAGKVFDPIQNNIVDESSPMDDVDLFQLVQDREPVEYLTGSSYFCDLKFKVNRDVMIPRKNSETLVNRAVFIASQMIPLLEKERVVRILDIGIGSGNLLFSVLHKIKESGFGKCCYGVGVDISQEALCIAATNRCELKLDGEVLLKCRNFNNFRLFNECTDADYLINTHYDGPSNGSFNIIICNPPYATPHSDRLPASRIIHEPSLALFGLYHSTSVIGNVENVNDTSSDIGVGIGNEYVSYVILAQQIASVISEDRLLRCSGQIQHNQYFFADDAHLVIEIGAGQCKSVVSIFERHAGEFLNLVGVDRDFRGIYRCLIFKVCLKQAK